MTAADTPDSSMIPFFDSIAPKGRCPNSQRLTLREISYHVTDTISWHIK